MKRIKYLLLIGAITFTTGCTTVMEVLLPPYLAPANAEQTVAKYPLSAASGTADEIAPPAASSLNID